MTDLAGKTVLLTGATGAIGTAIARAVAGQGARVLLHYCRNRDAAAALWAQAGATGPVHARVNNAGIGSEVDIAAPLAEWQAVWAREMQVNFTAAVDLTRAAILQFRRIGSGRIITMSSRAGQRGYAATAMAYGASKAALINLTKSVAQSFGAEGITALAIAPGWVRTEMAEAFIAQHGAAAALGGIPVGRMAEPAEIGALVAFALRPGMESLNGAVLDVNGASYLR